MKIVGYKTNQCFLTVIALLQYPKCLYNIKYMISSSIMQGNWVMRTSWGWWDEWDDTALQSQDSKFKPWRSEGEHATSRSRRLPTIEFYEWTVKKHVCFFQTAEIGIRTPNSSANGSGAKHYSRAPALYFYKIIVTLHVVEHLSTCTGLWYGAL